MQIKKAISLTLALLFVLLAGGFTSAVFADGTEIVRNLVLGLDYEVATGAPVEFSHLNYEPDTYNINTGQLTDGVTTLTDYQSAAWYRSMRGVSRIVTFDLGSFKAVYGFSAGFLHIRSMAIYAPRYVYVFLSEDGIEYQKVCEAKPDFDLWDSTARRAEISEIFDKVYKARYVRVEFCSDIFAYCDEIRVLGTDTLYGGETELVPDVLTPEPGFRTELNGVKDIIKIYNGYYPTQSIADNTSEELLPYIAYLQPNGSYTDTMFDAVAFVPCHTDYPSGGRLVKTSGKTGAVMSDWLLYLENTFAEGINTDALNTAVGKVYQTLGIKNKKFTVFFTLPFPTVLDQPFGDLDNDGTEENCRTLEERLAILKWFADLTYNTFNAGNYSNLKFGGFYWYRESVDYSETDHEAELIKQTTAYLDKKKQSILFDPFFLSVGFDHWEELGFSAAVMQPNLVFSDFYEHGMLSEFAQIIKKYNLGVEIETGEPGHFSDSNYEEYGLTYEYYLYYGWLTGYMDALKTYYQGAGPGTIYNFCHSSTSTIKGAYLRGLYDKTYRFIKGTYTAHTPSVIIPDFETVAGQKNVRVAMTIIDPDSENGDFKIIFTKQPDHGTVNALPGNKNIVYSANAGYSGTDTFEVMVFDKFTYSEPITVTVTVVDTAVSSEESSEDVSSQPTPDGISLWLILVIACILIVLAASVILFIRRRR